MFNSAINTRRSLACQAAAVLAILFGATSAWSVTQLRPDLSEKYGRIPLSFEPNIGQADDTVKFASHGDGYTVLLRTSDAVVVLSRTAHLDRPPMTVRPSLRRSMKLRSHAVRPTPAVIRLSFEGANRTPQVEALDRLPGVSNYYLGKDPTKWLHSIPTYAKVRYRSIYPGIDIIFRGGNQHNLEFDFVLAPGADSAKIRLALGGLANLRIASDGALVLKVAGGQVVIKKPSIYQIIDGTRKEIRGGYKLLKSRGSMTGGRTVSEVGIELASYDHRIPLVIDPVLSYSSYLGGSFAESFAIAVDRNGSAYVAGWASDCSFFCADFPVTTGPSFKGGNGDVFVTKFNPAGTQLEYSTLIGGSGFEQANDIAVDAGGSVYITGETKSGNFPISSTSPDFGGSFDGFIAKFNPNSSLAYSRYLGGNGFDVSFGIALKPSCRSDCAAYVTGETFSSDFPVTVGPSFAAAEEAFVAKLGSDGSTIYSRLLGGGPSVPTTAGFGFAFGVGIAVEGDGDVFVVGGTGSRQFPVTADPAFGGATDAFITKLSADGSELIYSTFLGGGAYEHANSIALRPGCLRHCAAYVAGLTYSADFPTTEEGFQRSRAGFFDMFVTKLSPDGEHPLYSTYLGGPWGSSFTSAHGIAVDLAGRAYLTGGTTSPRFPLTATGSSVSDPEFVFFTVHGGGSYWSAATTPWRAGITYSIAVDGATTPTTLYIGTGSGGVLKSTDGGATFGPTGLTAGPVFAVAFDGQSSPPALYAGTGVGLFKSTNGGVTFSSSTLAGTTVISLSVEGPSVVLAGTMDGLYKSTDGGVTATKAAGLPDGTEVFSLTGSSGPNEFAGTNRGVFRSTDGGLSFSPTSLTYPPVLAMATDSATTPPTVFAGGISANGSQDGFQNVSFASLPVLFPIVESLAVDSSTAPSTVYVGELSQQELGELLKSTDGGNSFGDTNLRVLHGGLQAIALDPHDASIIYGGELRDRDPVFAELVPNGSGLVFSTYIGGEGFDEGTGVAVAPLGTTAFLTGLTFSELFPTTASAFQKEIGWFYFGPQVNAYVAKIGSLNRGRDSEDEHERDDAELGLE